MTYEIPTIGVEEEYQLVDARTGILLPNCKQVMKTLRNQDKSTDADIQHELHLHQIEMASTVCQSLDEVRQALMDTRHVLSSAARTNGCELAAAGTNPLPIPEDPSVTPKRRYEAMTERFQQIARDLLIFGCHVHVAMPDRDLGLRVMNRCRRWLPFLQAVSANSPFWDGDDTGYASFRRELWAQWPMAGPPPPFEDLDDYLACVDQLTASGAIKDESFIYWDIRLSSKVPTIEFRGADVMTRVDEVVGYVGLVRAMVMNAIADEFSGKPVPEIRQNLLSYAMWQAARFGMSGDLVDVVQCRTVSSEQLLEETMATLSDALEATGEREPVDAFAKMLLSDGCGAARQRARFQATSALDSVVAEIAQETKSAAGEADPRQARPVT